MIFIITNLFHYEINTSLNSLKEVDGKLIHLLHIYNLHITKINLKINYCRIYGEQTCIRCNLILLNTLLMLNCLY